MRAGSIALATVPYVGYLAWWIAMGTSFNTQLVATIGVYTAVLFGMMSVAAVILAFIQRAPSRIGTFSRVYSIISAVLFVPAGCFWMIILLMSWARDLS